MKNNSKVFTRIALLCIVPMLSIWLLAQANWSSYVTMGDGLSISFSKVDAKTWTWRIRNDSYRTLDSFDYAVTYVDADTGRQKTDTGMQPYAMKRGEVRGGWVEFVANTRDAPRVTITKINWK